MNLEDRTRIYLTVGAAAVLYLASPFRLGVVCGESMSPSLRSGEFYLLDRRHYREHPVKAGDVIVFRRDGQNYIKRVLGTAGDRISVWKQRNSPEEELIMNWQLPVLRRAAVRSPWRLAFVLGEHRVPEDTCYVVGDHMSGSFDSRAFGPVPLRAIQGKVLFAPPAHELLGEVAVVRALPPAHGS